MTNTCDNCGANDATLYPIVHVPTTLTDANEVCRPCGNAMIRSMPSVWAWLPKETK